MGIWGLKTFLKNNEEYLAQKENICNTHLVIDANNLLFGLYASSHFYEEQRYRNDNYGGDLVAYGEDLEEFFENLKKCNISPVLVFDGSKVDKRLPSDFIESKEIELKRFGGGIYEYCRELNEIDQMNSMLPPQCLAMVLSNIANKYGAKRIQAPYYADTHIAMVANQLHCPVLSNDTDFFVYQLEKGFITLGSFEFYEPSTGSDGQHYIEALVFSHAKLINSMPGLRLEVLPLLGLLAGNKFEDVTIFDQFIRDGRFYWPYDGHFHVQAYNSGQKRMANFLTWLEGKSLAQAVDCVRERLRLVNREQLNKEIEKILRQYRLELANNLADELELIYPSERVCSPDHQTPVQFLEQQMNSDDSDSLIMLDMIFHNTHYYYKNVDDFSLPSSNDIKRRPYSMALVLLRAQSYANLSVYQRIIQEDRDAFYYYDRVCGEYAKLISPIRPMATLEGYGSLKYLDCYSMIALDKDTKLQLLMACFRSTAEEQNSISDTVGQVLAGPFVAQASLCFLLVKYIDQETKRALEPQFIEALMLTFVFYADWETDINKQSFRDDEMYGQLLITLRPYAYKNTPIATDQGHSQYRQIMHFITQVQIAYRAYQLVNCLLDRPYHQPRLELFFNALMIFNITRTLLLNETTMESICGDGLMLINETCNLLKTQVLGTES